jgi:hypothetical protein
LGYHALFQVTLLDAVVQSMVGDGRAREQPKVCLLANWSLNIIAENAG